MSTRYRFELQFRPGRYGSEEKRRELVEEIRAVAATCFASLPDYQILRGTPEELDDKVLSLARREDGTLAGFCSAVLLPVPAVGTVLHLGLTCIRPEDRGSELTHLLISKAVMATLLRLRPLGRLWISNCGCVLSSLGNVALHFDNVYPSPFSEKSPSPAHHAIARAINASYRDKMNVMPTAIFDPLAFSFMGSVRGTVFQKRADDTRYHHRVSDVNAYYRGILSFSDGDEVLQIGTVSLLTGFRYGLRRRQFRQALQSIDFLAEGA